MKKYKLLLVVLGLSTILSCTSTTHKGNDELERQPAIAQQTLDFKFVYVSYVPNKPSVNEDLSLTDWKQSTESARLAYLEKLFYASTREVSKAGKKREVCFKGEALDLVALAKQITIAKVIDRSFKVTASDDQSAIRIKYAIGVRTREATRRDFILENCYAGKEPILEGTTEPGEAGNSQEPPPSVGVKAPSQAAESAEPIFPQDGYSITDKAVIPSNLKKSIRLFELKSDYQNTKIKESDRPWKDKSIETEVEAYKLAVILQEYIYKGMADQNAKSANKNFIAQNSKEKFWCHMPWLNVGTSGREAIHGMTKERDLLPSPHMDIYKNTSSGTDWGIGYLNSYACKHLEEIFGGSGKRLETPNFTTVNFPHGTMTFKILFTSAQMDIFKEAFAWHGNISDSGSNFREVKPVRHIQMDVAIKDSSIKGTLAGVENWIMLSYYFDPEYDALIHYKTVTGEESPLAQLKIPKGFLKMRPQGVQFGLAKNESLIFTGSQTNNAFNMLNGPADNHKGSCLGCHASAGTGVPMVPGLTQNTSFSAFRINKKSLDMNQQVALAKRNFELAKAK